MQSGDPFVSQKWPFGAGHWQVPATHATPAGHVTPHPPQFDASDDTSMHCPLQSAFSTPGQLHWPLSSQVAPPVQVAPSLAVHFPPHPSGAPHLPGAEVHAVGVQPAHVRVPVSHDSPSEMQLTH